MFLHDGWDHIPGNMLFPAIFGKERRGRPRADPVPRLLLRRRLAAMMTQTAMTLLFGTAAEARVPEPGASGAIAAVLGAYFVLYPGSRIRTWNFPIFLVRIPAWNLLGLWILNSPKRASGRSAPPRTGGGVALIAHVGGFISGLLAARPLARAGQAAPRHQWRSAA